MANLKPQAFYPDFHAKIRKDGKVNGIEPVTLKDMGLPYDLDYPDQVIGELSKELYENLVEEFIFLIDELLPRDIQDPFYKATLAPRRAYWKLFEEAARRMQLLYYLNCHRTDANGDYGNIKAGIEYFLREGRSMTDIYLNTCITKEMLLDVVDWSIGPELVSDERIRRLLYVELVLFKSSKYNYERLVKLTGCPIDIDLVLYNMEHLPILIVMVFDSDIDCDDLLTPDHKLKNGKPTEYDLMLDNIHQVEQYCKENEISFLTFTFNDTEALYSAGALGKIIRESINNPQYSKKII